MKNLSGCDRQVWCAGSRGVDRRTVLRMGAAGSVMVMALPIACGVDSDSVTAGPIAAGKVSSVSIDTLRVIAEGPVVLGRDANGLYAMSAVCTHQSCRVSASGNAVAGVSCGCHGSRFDRTGAVTAGPASSPLQHFRVELSDDGSITVRGDMPVGVSDRTPVT